MWRYFKVERFLWTLQNARLYFAASTQFTDRFEGATAVLPPDFPVDPRFQQMEGSEGAFFALRKLMKISCWHREEYESDAMWKLYAEQSKGVAISTTADRMKKAIQPFRLQPSYGIEDLWAGPVAYHDLMAVRLRPLGKKIYFAKHRAFSWEKEFRLLISPEMASEFVPDIPEDGIEVSVDLDALIEHIMLGPELSAEDRDHIVAKSREIGLGDRVRKSSLLGQPRFI
ncbi:MAG TPA: DUF2971 domain-containing protein [Terracidiphilus sp.]